MKAISRNEKYLSKLSGEEEVVPKPISRKEKYMYRACGYIDKPIPKHAISREEKYWKKIIENGGGGSAVLTSKDITENGLYNAVDDEADGYSSVNVDVPNTYLLSDEGKVVSDGALVSQTSSTVSQNGVIDTTLIDSVNVNVPNINNILFAPPQKFKSNGSNLLDYKIYGNNTPHNYSAEGTLPLTFSTHTAGNASDWEIRGNNDNGTENLMQIIATSKTQSGIIFTVDGDGRITINGTATGVAVIYLDWVWGGIAVNAVEPNTTYTVTGGLNTAGVTFYWGTFNSDSTTTQTAIATTATITTSANAEKSRAYIYITEGTVCDNLVCEPMLVKGSTAPDHYIPYQQGVGERTENLFDESDFSLVKVTSTAYRYGTIIGILPQGTYTLTATKAASAPYIYLTKKNNGTYTFEEITNVPYTFTADGVSQYILRIAEQDVYESWAQVGYSQMMIVEGSTAPSTYVPFGYEIPISVNGTPQTFYIGNAPLTAGQSISKTSTGVDIAAMAGSNTITTSLYNKPSMSIEGVDYLGVGEPVNDGWHIPVKINSTTTNVPIDAPLVENEYVSYIDQKIYHYIDGTLTPVDPPSTLPHITTANGVNELSIDVEVQPELVGIGLGNPIELVNT